MRTDRTSAPRRYWAAGVFLVLGAALGVWHNRQVDRGRQDPVVAAVRGAVGPPVAAVDTISSWWARQTGWLVGGHAMAEENRALRARVQDLEGENAALRESRIDYERLRKQLNFVAASPKRLIAADVLALRPDPNFATLVISRGSRDGVHVNSVVRSPNGLVGHVFEVTPGTASVIMITDAKSGVGARVQRSRAIGVCEGDNSPFLEMRYLPFEADVKAGDTIVTSGLGGVYPPGLMIGTVSRVKADEGNVGKSARVQPLVDLGVLEEVYVEP